MNRMHVLVGLVAMTTGACGLDLDLDLDVEDPRVGDEGRLAFRSEGCSSTRVMAVGSRAKLRLETTTGAALPQGMDVTTSSPQIIVASLSGDEVTVVASDRGASYLSVLVAGEPYDGIGLSAVVATRVRYRTVPRVLIGGQLEVVVDEVFGCGLDACPLFGHSFLSWRSEPSQALTLLGDGEGIALLVANAPGKLLASEPSNGRDLVSAEIETVAIQEITEWTASLVALTPGSDASEDWTVSEDTLPATVHSGDVVCLRLDGAREGALAVAVSRRDVDWTVAGPLGPPVDFDLVDPLCTLFVAGDPGEVALVVSSPLFAEEPAFSLTVQSGT
jgi:hypothetical protein